MKIVAVIKKGVTFTSSKRQQPTPGNPTGAENREKNMELSKKSQAKVNSRKEMESRGRENSGIFAKRTSPIVKIEVEKVDFEILRKEAADAREFLAQQLETQKKLLY